MRVFTFLSPSRMVADRPLASASAPDAAAKAKVVPPDSSDLRSQLDRLQMICEAMWQVIKERVGSDDEHLLKLVEQIDLRDGRLDGRSAPAASNCSACGRMVSVRTGVCLFCGETQNPKAVF